MSEQTEWVANARFAALVSGNAFHTRELAEGKLDLFLNIPMKVLETTPALARCIVGALLKRSTRPTASSRAASYSCSTKSRGSASWRASPARAMPDENTASRSS